MLRNAKQQMKHQITITPIRKEPPELDRFVAVLLALALARLEAEAAEQRSDEADEEEASGG